MRKRAAAWACHPGELPSHREIQALDQTAGFFATIPSVSLRSETMLASSPMSRGRRSRSLTGRRIYGACGPSGIACSTQIDHVARLP
jgi:hypothetical protein